MPRWPTGLPLRSLPARADSPASLILVTNELLMLRDLLEFTGNVAVVAAVVWAMTKKPGTRPRVTAVGLAVMLLAVSAGVASAGEFGLLLGLVGILVGANIVTVGVRMDDEPVATTPIGPVAFAPVGAFTASVRRNLAVLGIIAASSAVTAVSGEAGPVLCFAMLVAFLAGLCLIYNRVRGE